MEINQNKEIELAKRAAGGDRRAMDELIQLCLPLVKSIAQKYIKKCPNHLEFDDLYQTGVIGLMEAINNFDPMNGTKFSTYAYPRIKGSIVSMLVESGLIRIPEVTYWRKKKKHKEIQIQILSLDNRKNSFYEGYGVDGHEVDMEYFVSQQSQEIENQFVNYLSKLEASIGVKTLLEILSPRERQFIEGYFGIGQFRPMTVGELALILKSTRRIQKNILTSNPLVTSSVCKTLARAIKKMKDFVAKDTNLALGVGN